MNEGRKEGRKEGRRNEQIQAKRNKELQLRRKEYGRKKKRKKERRLKAENPHRQREAQHFLDKFWIFDRTHTAHEPHFLLVQVSVLQQFHYRLECRFVSCPQYCAVNC